MISVVLYTFPIICALTVTQLQRHGLVSAAMQTVVGVAGRKVSLPCRSEAVGQEGVGVCWGRGESSLFTCHNTLVATNGAQVIYKNSFRYRLPSDVSSHDVSLTIYNSRQSDSGFYHCRVQLPGLFNDQTFSIHLIITNALDVTSFTPDPKGDHIESEATSSPLSYVTTDVTGRRGNYVPWDSSTGPVVAHVKTSEDQSSSQSTLKSFIGNTVRLAFIIFLPALLLIIGYRVCRLKQKAVRSRKQKTDPDLFDQEENSL